MWLSSSLTHSALPLSQHCTITITFETWSHSTLCWGCVRCGWGVPGFMHNSKAPRGEGRHLRRQALPAWPLSFGLHRSLQKKFPFNPHAPCSWGSSPWILGSSWARENHPAVSVTCWGVGNFLLLSSPSHSHLFSRIWGPSWSTGGQGTHSLCPLMHCLWLCCCPKPWSEKQRPALFLEPACIYTCCFLSLAFWSY